LIDADASPDYTSSPSLLLPIADAASAAAAAFLHAATRRRDVFMPAALSVSSPSAKRHFRLLSARQLPAIRWLMCCRCADTPG